MELNASDTRSKKSLKTEVAELLGNHTLMDYMGKKQFSSHYMEQIVFQLRLCRVLRQCIE